MAFWVYMLRCSDGSYYTGHTDDLDSRIAQHHAGLIPGCCTLDRRPLQLVYSQPFESREDALAAERRIKGWRRPKKEALIAGRFDRLPVLARTARNRDAAAPKHPARPSTGSGRTESGAGSTNEPYTDDRGRRVPCHGTVVDPVRSEPVEGHSPAHHAIPEAVRPEPVEGRMAARDGAEAQAPTRTDLHWMRHALSLAEQAEREHDEIPVGAVLIGADGELLGEGSNRNIAEHDPTAHAEIVAMRAAGRRVGNHRLVGATMYVTLEPCAMCAMAMVHARIARLVFAAADPKTGACGSVFDLLADPRHNHRVDMLGGVLGTEASTRLTNYFRRKRGKPPI